MKQKIIFAFVSALLVVSTLVMTGSPLVEIAGTQLSARNIASNDNEVDLLGGYEITVVALSYDYGLDVSVSITMDGNPTGYFTPHTFGGLLGTHTITVPGIDAVGRSFKLWNTGSNNSTITVSEGGTYTAYYQEKYNLTIASTAGGTVDPAPGNYSYWKGTVVKVKALPSLDPYYLDHWTIDGAYAGPWNPKNFTMNKNYTILAVFNPCPPPETWEASQPPVNRGAYYKETTNQPRRVDPARAYDTASGELIQNVYQPLIWFSDKPVAPDADTNFTAHPELIADLTQFEPILATSMPTISPDGKTWTFTVNTSATFQPWYDHSGNLVPPTPVTAADVEYTFKRMLVQDMPGAPSWMIALPGTGNMYYDAFDTNPATPEIEPVANETALGNLIENFVTTSGNDVTFHFVSAWPGIALYQIFAHTCSSIVSKAFCIEHGCWEGSFAAGWSKYRRYPSSSYTPLDRWVATSKYTNDAAGNKNGWGNGDVPAMIGTGPYKFTLWDKANKVWRIDYYPAYWKGWADAGNKGGVPGVSYFTSVVGRATDQWKTGKMLFLEGYDEIEVPRAHMYDLLISHYVPNPGIRLYYNMPQLSNDAVFFNFINDPASPYQSKVGTGGSAVVRSDFFNNTHLRTAFAYALNFTAYLHDAWFDEAIQPTSWWVESWQPDYKNKTLVPHDLDIARIQYELTQATFPSVPGNVWTQGFETYLVFDFGNDQRRIAAELIQQTFASLGSKYKVNVVGLDWPVFLDYEEWSYLPMFFSGWWADFADADSFARPYMYSQGDLAYYQGYSDPHVDYLIDLGIAQPDVNVPPPPDYPTHTNRNGTYQELQYIYYRDNPSLPLIQAVGRRWTRDWVKGWYYNPLYPGNYYYDLYKTGDTPLAGVDLRAQYCVALEFYPVVLGYHGGMREGGGSTAFVKMTYVINVTYEAGSVPFLRAAVGLRINSTNTYEYANATTYVVLSPGQSTTVTFEWCADGVEQTAKPGIWDVQGVVFPINASDTDFTDNAAADGTVNVSRLLGDVNGDSVVDIYDAILLSNAFDRTERQTRFNADADFKADGAIDIYDAIILSNNFNKHVP